MAPPLVRQTWALMRKNLIINLRRSYLTTVVRAFILPVIFISFISFSRYLFQTPAIYGIGTPAPIRDLPDALALHGNKPLVFVNNGVGDHVNELIQSIETQLKGTAEVKVLDAEVDLRTECKQSLRGVSPCFAAVAFQKSPTVNGIPGSKWNYTVRGDYAITDRLNVENHDNGVQQFILPVQFAVDRAIAKQENASSPDIQVNEYMYTDLTKEEYLNSIVTNFAQTLINYASVVLLIGMVGVVYHLSGFQAIEREKGLSTLIEAMGGPNTKYARILAYILAFTMIYLPGWVIISLSIWGGFFKSSNVLIIVLWTLLTGLSLASWAVLLGSIFKKAQLSGVSVTVFSLVLGIIAQVSKNAGTTAFTILSFLFPPMNYVFFSISIARFEKNAQGANIVEKPPSGNSKLPLVVFWVFDLIQIIVFPILAVYVERYLYGTNSMGHRIISRDAVEAGNAIEIRGFTKRFQSRFLSRLFGKNKEAVLAVNDLNLTVLEGQVMLLVGANGSGKTTTLEAIAGLSGVDEGEIRISAGAGAGKGTGIGICPQKNVLWDELTVLEHVKIWNLIKCPGDDLVTIKKLIEDCDLTHKRHAKCKTLSGGQKRKLQLAAMFTGGSTICAVDEVSSGLDPISRRKIWDIILAARGSKTVLMTSQFLDEADLLADQIAILSKGNLKCRGSAVQLKTEYGSGYRVHAPLDSPQFPGISMNRFYDKTVYSVKDATEANRLVDALEKNGVTDYYVNGPTIEDVFLNVAEESVAARRESRGEKLTISKDIDQISSTHSRSEGAGADLHNGRQTSVLEQAWTMILKRITILQRGYLPTIAAIAIPLVAAGITMTTFKNFKGVSCLPAKQLFVADVQRLDANIGDYKFAIGPKGRAGSALSTTINLNIPSLAGDSGGGNGQGINLKGNLSNMINYVDSTDSFNKYINDNHKDVLPGGFFLGSTNATFAYKGNDDASLVYAMNMLNVVDNDLLSVSGGIAMQYLPFDISWPDFQSQTLLFITYAGIAFAVFPAFFALYPTVERIRKVRALHYSNGVRALPLWLAYTAFDFVAILFISAISAIIFQTATNGWYGNMGYMFLIMMLYGVTSAFLVYCISLVATSQLAAFAFSAGYQAALFLIYFMVNMGLFTFAKPDKLDSLLKLTHNVIAAVAPIVSLVHAFFVALNSFSISCSNDHLEPNPAAFRLFGGPILYLFIQSIVLFSFLVLYDSGKLAMNLNINFRKTKPTRQDEEDSTFNEKEIEDEVHRVDSSDDCLRVRHLSKKFGKVDAVDDVTFGVPNGEVFALLGPNGAGKTTIINMIRGEIPPTSGEILVQNIQVTKNRSAARSHLGVCPQFDAIDRMTVMEHLIFYARIRGVKDVDYNVNEVIRAVGLEEFKFRFAEKLSGGNKRKLSLGIALMGNPTVLLLDEPSSGMDAAAKRVMWQTLESIVPGRSIVLTTHSMEECSALAKRAGILAKHMLALDTTERLRRKYGNKYLVHLVLSSAPYSSEAEMENVKQWILDSFSHAELEARSFGGQIRFSIAARIEVDGGADELNTVGHVFSKLEREGTEHGLQFWSVDRGTMDMVFLDVVGRARVQEEGADEEKKRKWKKIVLLIFAPWMYFIR